MTHLFEIGEIAMLNSGGPDMTIVRPLYALASITNQHYECVWIEHGGKVCTHIFPAPCLTWIEREAE